MDFRVLAGRCASSPIFWVVVVGLLARIVSGIFLTYPYDSGSWSKIAESVVAGTALYDRPDNYYAPIWGYVLAFLTSVYTTLGGSTFGNQFDELLFLDSFRINYYGSVIIDPAFCMLIKIFLFLVDLAVALIIRRIVLDLCGDRGKADLAFALWFLCPLVIYSSAVYVIFDNIEVLLFALCFLAMVRDRPFIAGFMMLMAGMVKPFAFYLVPLILVYFICSRTGLKDRVNVAALAIGGFAAAFLLTFMPVMITGNFDDAMVFLTGRVDSAGGSVTSISYILTSFGSQVFMWLQPVIIGIALVLAWVFYKRGGRDMRRLLFYCALVLFAVFFWPVAQQCYYLILVMILALMVVYWDRQSVTRVIVAISVLSVMFLLCSHNFSLLLSLSVYTDLISTDWLLDSLVSYNTDLSILGTYLYEDVRELFQALIMVTMVASAWLLHRRFVSDECP